MSIFYKSEQVAELLGVALPRVRQLANDGKLRTKLQDGDTLVSADSLVGLADDSNFGLLKNALPAFARSQGLGTGSLFSIPAIAGLLGNSGEGISDMVRNGLLSSVTDNGEEMITGNSLSAFLADKSPENDATLDKAGDFALGQLGLGGGSGLGGKLAAGAAGLAGVAGLTGVVSDIDIVGSAKGVKDGITTKAGSVSTSVSETVKGGIEGGKGVVRGAGESVGGAVSGTVEKGKDVVSGTVKKEKINNTPRKRKSSKKRQGSGGSTTQKGQSDSSESVTKKGEGVVRGESTTKSKTASSKTTSTKSGTTAARGGGSGGRVVAEETKRRGGFGWLLPLLLLGLLLLALLWFLRGCGDNGDAVPVATDVATAEVAPATVEPTAEPEVEATAEDVSVPALNNVAAVAADNGNFNTLLTALGAAGLAETFSDADGGPFTVFAPTDDAFAALPEGTLDTLLADPDALAEVLKYHVVEGNVDGATAATLASATTLQGKDIAIAVGDDGGLVLNGATNVTGADVAAGNSVIHVIDSVLLPPADEVAQVEEVPAPATPGTIAEVATEAGTFNTLLAALTAAGLADTFADAEGGPFTVFAPSDEAFAALPEGTVEALLADPEALSNILTYHVVEGTVLAEDVVGLDSATTLNGEEISIALGNVGVVLNDSINVVQTDILASNGVIHVIDGVLIPAAAEEEAAPVEPAETVTETEVAPVEPTETVTETEAAPVEPTETVTETEPVEEAPAEPGSVTVTIPPLVKGEESPSMAFNVVGADGTVVVSGMTGDTVSVDAGTYDINIQTNPVTTISGVEVGSGAAVTVSP